MSRSARRRATTLTGPERQRLFSVVRGLKTDGVVIIYITHFLDEIFSVCERVTIMRNGETVWSSPISEVDPPKVVHLMLGVAENEGRIRAPVGDVGEPLLAVKGLRRDGVLRNVDFEIRRGEIVGLWGLLGSGRTELLRALVGLDPIDGGTISWRDGYSLTPIAPERLHAHVGMITEDRRGEGVHLPLSISDNIALPNLKSLLNRWRLIDRGHQNALADAMIDRLKIKAWGWEQIVATLSGGNQQKVVFGRWLATNPRLFLLDEPGTPIRKPRKAALEKADRWAPTGQPKHMWLATNDLLSAAVPDRTRVERACDEVEREIAGREYAVGLRLRVQRIGQSWRNSSGFQLVGTCTIVSYCPVALPASSQALLRCTALMSVSMPCSSMHLP